MVQCLVLVQGSNLLFPVFLFFLTASALSSLPPALVSGDWTTGPVHLLFLLEIDNYSSLRRFLWMMARLLMFVLMILVVVRTHLEVGEVMLPEKKG